MADLVVNVAVIGRVQLTPGILPVTIDDSSLECLVAHAFPPNMEAPGRGVKIDTSDCTVFTVTHRERGAIDLKIATNAQEIFDQSLTAISEVLIWTKSKEKVGGMSSFIRQIGTTDIKAFFAQGDSDEMIGWINPSFTFNRDAAAVMAGFLSNMIVSNGPSSNPMPNITRRIMSSLDLINLGFYTESFVNLFSLVDDLTQEVIKAGMMIHGLKEDEQKNLLRAIKEERLKVYLCNLAKLCGWKSLEEIEKELYRAVLKVNSTRNRIMHGARRLSRNEAIESSNVLLKLIDWLRNNPFGFTIPNFPALRVANAKFFLVPLKEDKEQNENSKNKDPDEKPPKA